MTLTADQFDVMAYLWAELPKSPDPAHITFTATDIEALWLTGFVDAVRVSQAAWRAAFDPHRQPDGTFRLAEHDFRVLERYRYTGEIHLPFDALRINEGLYTEEGLQELIAESILPSIAAEAGKIDQFFTALKKPCRQPTGLLKIDLAAKRKIKALIDQYPSPLRRLELVFDAMIRQQMFEATVTGKLPTAVTPEEVARVEASAFATLPHHPVERHARGLKALQKSRPPRSPAAPDGAPITPLTKLRRSRKGVRG